MIERTAVLVAELVALFFGVAFLVHITQRRLGPERLRGWMGGPPVVSALKGTAVGFITPFCTYSAIPMLIGLRQAGVPPAGYVAFIVAAPVLDPVLFGALAIIVGVKVAIVYIGVAFTAAMALALLAERIDIGRLLKPMVSLACEDETCSDASPTWEGVGPEVRRAAGAALVLMRSLGPVLLLGVGIGLVIELLVPPEIAATIAGGNNPMSIPIAAGLGTPLYFNTELFVPIADALAGVGVGVGAIVALTIAGAGANIPEFVVLGRMTKGRVLAVFAGYVMAVAIAGGVLAQLVA